MNHARTAGTAATALLFFTATIFGTGISDLDLKAFGNASAEYQQVVKGNNKLIGTGDLLNVWAEKVFLGFGLQVLFSPADTFRGALEVKMFNEFPRLPELAASKRLYHYPYIREAQFIRKCIATEKVSVTAGGGFFSYKYNPDVRNLGEYLFRSTVYPQTLSTEFDFPFARLMGLYGKGSYRLPVLGIPTTLSADLIIASSQEWLAIHDINGAIIASWNIADIFEIGGGASYSSILSADSNATTPHRPASAYYDSATGDTAYYTFAGAKVMLRTSLDAKKLVTKDGFGGFLGPEDLKLYSEATLIGVKNYPAALLSPIWYMSPLERIPVTVGLNWFTYPLLSYPVTIVPELFDYLSDRRNHQATSRRDIQFDVSAILVAAATATSWISETFFAKKLRLDVLSMEFEWWGNRYPNSMEGIVLDGVPLPFTEGTEKIVDRAKYIRDNQKWSIYGKKTFADHYLITFQIASDHMRTFALNEDRQDWEEALHGPSRWYYVVKAGVVF